MTPDLVIAREIERGLRVFAWLKTKDAQLRDPQLYPDKPLPLTHAEREAQKPERDKYDATPIEKMRVLLGWDKGQAVAG